MDSSDKVSFSFFQLENLKRYPFVAFPRTLKFACEMNVSLDPNIDMSNSTNTDCKRQDSCFNFWKQITPTCISKGKKWTKTFTLPTKKIDFKYLQLNKHWYFETNYFSCINWKPDFIRQLKCNFIDEYIVFENDKKLLSQSKNFFQKWNIIRMNGWKIIKFSSFPREIDIFSHYRNHKYGIAFNLDTLVTDNWHIIKILSRATINYCSLSPSIIYCNFWNNSYFFCLKMERDQTNWC